MQCSADFQSAVSRISNPQPAAIFQRAADWKSAIQQVGNLRYSCVSDPQLTELSVPSNHLLKRGVLVGWDLTGKLGPGAIPLLQPIRIEQFMPAGSRRVTRCRRKGDGGLEFFSSAPASGHVETSGEQRNAVRG
jgi:hypothetical protein